MNTKDTEYYVRIVKQKDFTEVANYFRVNQPTITYALQRLEKEFDTVLTTRNQSYYELIVTPSGKQLFLHARTILQEISTARAEIAQLQKRKLRSGIPPVIGNKYFPELSSYFIKHELMNQIEITDGSSRDLYGMIRQGRIDLAILDSTQPIVDQYLETELLLDKRFMIIVPSTYPLSKQGTVSFKNIASEQFVLLDEHYVHPAASTKLSKQTRTHPKVIYQSNDLTILKSMVRENVGIDFLAEIAVYSENHLVCLPFSGEVQPRFLTSLVKQTQQIVTPLQEQVAQVIHEFTTAQKNSSL